MKEVVNGFVEVYERELGFLPVRQKGKQATLWASLKNR